MVLRVTSLIVFHWKSASAAVREACLKYVRVENAQIMRRAVLFAIPGLCITCCVAQKLRIGFELGKHRTNRSAKHFIMISSRAVYSAGNGSYSRFSGCILNVNERNCCCTAPHVGTCLLCGGLQEPRLTG